MAGNDTNKEVLKRVAEMAGHESMNSTVASYHGQHFEKSMAAYYGQQIDQDQKQSNEGEDDGR